METSIHFTPECSSNKRLWWERPAFVHCERGDDSHSSLKKLRFLVAASVLRRRLRTRLFLIA